MASLSYEEAAHLLRRMGFGGTPPEIEDVAARGREGAVDYLINYGQIDNRTMDDALERSFDFSDPTNNQRFNRNELQRWWFTRMVLTKRQFEEKMSLFWHNHFATSFSKVQETLMYVQNGVLRANALERFDTLLLKVSQDPAMLVWLDNITNVRGRPNENFAREIQELFTMGINDVVTGEPNYTEDDVKEVARAFTGWSFRRPNARTEPYRYEFFVNAAQHDNGSKTIYGQTANFDGTDVITVLSARRATARYLVKKLFEFFVYQLDLNSSGDKATIDQFADVYMNRDHSIKELVRAIFSSDEFFSKRARFGLVKTPVEFIVDSIRMLGAKYTPGNSAEGARRDNGLYIASAAMGMQLFNPPDVAGWDFNLGWVNTATMLTRYNFANAFITQRNAENPGAHVSNDLLRSYTKPSSKKTVRKFLEVLGPLDVDTATVKKLRNYLETNDQGNTVAWVVDDATIDKKVRGLVHQIMSLPEYELA